MVTSSKMTYASMLHLPELLLPMPQSWGQPLLTHASAGDSQTLTGNSGWVSCGGHCSFLLCSGTHKVFPVPSKSLWRVWGLILNMIAPFLPSYCGFSFVLGHGVSFFGRFQHPPVDGCSVASCNFGVLSGNWVHILLLFSYIYIYIYIYMYICIYICIYVYMLGYIYTH